MTDEIAYALSNIKHIGNLHYSWDLLSYEKSILEGIRTLSQHIKPYRQTCYVLTGYNTTHEEDIYRVNKLANMGVIPYIMKFDKKVDDIRLNHFARWVNGHFYKNMTFEEYEPWRKNSQKINYKMDDLFQACG